MKKLIGALLALLLLVGCAGQGGNAGSLQGVENHSSGYRYDGTLHVIHYELGDLEDVFTVLPTEARDGSLVEIRTRALTDADVHLRLDDGREIGKSHSDGDYREYSFTMPDRDVVITATPYTETELFGFAGTDMAFIKDVRCVSPDGGGSGEDGTRPFWVSSVEELREACQRFLALSEVLDQYDASFFSENDLIVVVLQEGSCSNRHKLTGVKLSPSQTAGKLYLLQPEITRYCPEGGLDLCAEMYVLIAIDKEYGQAVSELAEPVFQEVIVAG